jgi:hypothetical protein
MMRALRQAAAADFAPARRPHSLDASDEAPSGVLRPPFGPTDKPSNEDPSGALPHHESLSVGGSVQTMGVAAWGKGPFGSCTLETEGPSGALRLAVAPETNFHNESPFGNMRQAAAL